MIDVPKPILQVSIAGVDVSTDLTAFIEKLAYTDNIEGEADTLDIVLDNSDDRFINDWYPDQGDSMTAKIGDGTHWLECGDFEIDEVETVNNLQQLVIKAIATGVSRNLRTRKGVAYDDTSLQEVAERVARSQNLRIVGVIEDIPLGRVTQVHETDLQFLHRIGKRFGYVFSVKGDQLVFHIRSQLVAQPVAKTIYRNEVSEVRLREKLRDIPTVAELSYTPPETNNTVTAIAQNNAEGSVDKLRLVEPVENEQQAKAVTQAALDTEAEQRITGDLTVEGDVSLVAGVLVELADFGKFSKQYLVGYCKHNVTRGGGWSTNIDLKTV